MVDTVYPGAIDPATDPTSANNLSVPSHSLQHRTHSDAIHAIETELGTDPKETYGDVKARLDAEGVYIGTSAPASPVAGKIWSNPSTGLVQRYSGSKWIALGGAAVQDLAALTGDPIFPYNGGVATTRTDSVNATLTDSTYSQKVVQLDTWTINAGIIASLQGGPWFIFVGTLTFGNTLSQISGDGPTGASTASTQYAVGGYHSNGHVAGGCGGVMVFICAGTINGANGIISANGGNAVADATNIGSTKATGGMGVFSTYVPVTSNFGLTYSQKWDGNMEVRATSGATGNVPYTYMPSLYSQSLGAGGDGDSSSAPGGTGGGNGSNGGEGGAATGRAGGGSGIGGGGGARADSSGASNGGVSALGISIRTLLGYADRGCKGGGGGGCGSLTASVNAGGGGGGGSVALWVQTLTNTPTLSANGGTGAVNGGSATAGNGGAGVTHLVDVP